MNAGDPVVYMINREEQQAVVLGIDHDEFWIYVYGERMVVRSHLNHVGTLNGKVYVFNAEWRTPVDQVLSDISNGNQTRFHPCRSEATLKQMEGRLKAYGLLRM